MKKKYNLITIITFLFVAVFSTAAVIYTPPTFKNLKVLPKNISEHKLDSIMDQYNYSLGVNCDFCHVQNKNKDGLSFESDAKPEKKIARKMMMMTYEINTKHFFEKPNRIEGQRITCNTCHNQNAIPTEIGNEKAKNKTLIRSY